MSRELLYYKSALAEMKRLPAALRQEARDRIDRLSTTPIPHDAKKLRGHEDYYRIPFGSHRFRIIYRVRPDKLIVARVRARGEAYQGL